MASIAGNMKNASVAPRVHMAAVLRDADGSPRTMSGKRPTAAALQRKRENMEWIASPKRAAMCDNERDDSHEAFLKEREHKRLQKRDVQRREGRRT